MPPINEKRERTLDLLTGPVLQVTIISPDSDDEKSWTLPKALLCHNSGYFSRLHHFKEGHEGKVTLNDFEPETFKLFIEFLYFGRYSYRDDLEDYNRVRDSAKAWVMGDYLDAVEFKNFAITNLHEIYFPISGEPKAGVGPGMIEYCCANSHQESPLYKLYEAFVIRNWHRADIVIYCFDNREEWADIWTKYPKLSEAILYFTNEDVKFRVSGHQRLLLDLLEKATTTKEPQVAHDPVTKTSSSQ